MEDEEYNNNRASALKNVVSGLDGKPPLAESSGLSSIQNSIGQRHKLIKHQQQRRPRPYALAKEDTALAISKNKNIHQFQIDVSNLC